jgi:hypothetical protein
VIWRRPMVSEFSKPARLTLGDQSPPTFAPVVAKLAKALPRRSWLLSPGAGHIHTPHIRMPTLRQLSLLRARIRPDRATKRRHTMRTAGSPLDR